MIYTAAITRAKNGSSEAPIKTALRVTKGLVYKVTVDFPPGSAGLMGIAIYDGGYQVWPSTIGKFFTGDGVVISFDDVYLKESAPYEFGIYAYNNDHVYEHTVNVHIGLVSKEIFMARFLPHLSYKYFEKMLKTLQQEQLAGAEQQRQETLNNPFPWL